MTPGWYPEQAVAERLQLTRSSVEFYRRSLKKSEWEKNGKEILLSPEAVKKLLEKLGSPDYDISSCAIKETGEKPKPEVVVLIIERVYPNPRLLLAKVPETGELVRVMVPINVNFRPRMQIQARPPLNREGPQLYRLEGRVPRFCGKW
jgi:hypothetical protein